MREPSDLDGLRGDLADLEQRGGADYLRHLHNFIDRLDATPSLKALLARFEEECRTEFEASLEADLGFVARLVELKADFVRVAQLAPEPGLPDDYQPRGNESSLAYFDWLAARAHSRFPPVETIGSRAEEFLSERMRTILYGHVYWARYVHENGQQHETPLHSPLSAVASRLEMLQTEIRHASVQHHDSVQTAPGPHLLALRRMVGALNPAPVPPQTSEEFSAWALGPRERVLVFLAVHYRAGILYHDDRHGASSNNAQEVIQPIRNSVAALWRSIERNSTGQRRAPPVSLRWDTLSPTQFEELVAAILRSTPEYQNVELLMGTNAPDGGRDISAFRSQTDSLGDTVRERVIAQCKHYPNGSVSPTDINDAVVGTSQWGHPPVDLLIFATSGHFTQPAVRHIEQHNEERKRPRILPWSRVNLESALSSRPELAQGFGLR